MDGFLEAALNALKGGEFVNLLKRHKKYFISAVIAFSVLLMILTAAYRTAPTVVGDALGFVIAPVQSVFTRTGRWVGNTINFFIHLRDIEFENIRLRADVNRMEIELNRLSQVDRENVELARLLDIARKYAEFPTVGANIISKEPGNWFTVFTIDKGRNSGFERNMVVLSAGGLAGKIFEVGATYSKIVSLIDDSSSVSAKIARSNDMGLVRGDITLRSRGMALMEGIRDDADIVEGDLIVTGHLSSIYPPGIPIGYVTEVNIDINGTKYAFIEPVVDFRHMEFVLVITQLFEHEMIE